MARGFDALMLKLSKKNRLRMAALYHYFVKDHNKYGGKGQIRESLLNSWLGPDPYVGHLEWKQRNPYMSNEQMLRAMVIIYNKQQGCTHYTARMIYDKTEGGEMGDQMTLI
jgi:hypothetical protein